MAYLDCIHELVSTIFTVFIGSTLLPGASVIVRLQAVAAEQAGVCMWLYSFAVHISLSHACLH